MADSTKYLSNTGTANALVVSKNGFTLADGVYFEVKTAEDNTDIVTANVNSTGVISCRNEKGEEFAAGKLKAGYHKFIYDGTNDFFVQAPSGGDLENLLPENIRQGVDINGVIGNLIEGAKIKSFQLGSAIILANSNSINVSISQVDLTKSIIIVSLNSVNSTIRFAGQTAIPSASFIDNKTIEVKLGGTYTSTVNIQVIYTVYEFENAIIQSGVSQTTGAITVSPYNYNKAFLVASFDAKGSKAEHAHHVLRLVSTGTSINAYIDAYQPSTKWFLIEFEY